MFEQAISTRTKQSLEILSSSRLVKESFYLAAGTAAALQLGHRISEDLDFFSQSKFSVEELADFLVKNGKLMTDKKLEDTLLGSFDGTKVSFFFYPYPLLENFISYLSVNLASLSDIACMKIDAISSRGLKRDFIDLFFIIKKQDKILSDYLELFEKKYAKVRYNLNHIKKSLAYFDNADKDSDPKMLLSDFSWPEVKKFFEQEIKKLS